MKISKKKLKPISKEDREKYLQEFVQPIDYTKVEARGIFINIDQDIIQYFKDLAGPDGKGYQKLMLMALRHYKENGLKPKLSWDK